MRIDEGIQAKQIYSTIRGKGKRKKLKFFEKKLSRQKKEDKEVDFYVFYFFYLFRSGLDTFITNADKGYLELI